MTLSGKAEGSDSITVTATDSTNAQVSTTVTASGGTWTVPSLDVSTLKDGPITYTATDVSLTPSTSTTLSAIKDTAAPTVTISSVTSPINSTNAPTTTVSGTAAPGATVSVVASEGSTSTPATPVTTTAGASGTWSVSNLAVGSLGDGLVTYTATETDAAKNTATGTLTAPKQTVAPTASINTVTSPVTSANAAVSGTGVPGNTVAVTVTDSTNTSATTPAVLVGTDGTWSAVVNVSSLKNGTITFNATATDAAGNTFAATKQTATLSLS